jgi:hypothetical protein
VYISSAGEMPYWVARLKPVFKPKRTPVWADNDPEFRSAKQIKEHANFFIVVVLVNE